jgi:hypothetical protein
MTVSYKHSSLLQYVINYSHHKLYDVCHWTTSWLIFSFTCKYQARLEVAAIDKHSSLLWYGINYNIKKYYNLCPEWHDSILALATNIKLGWEWLPVTNSLAYYAMELIAIVKCFVTYAWMGWLHFSFTCKY